MAFEEQGIRDDPGSHYQGEAAGIERLDLTIGPRAKLPHRQIQIGSMLQKRHALGYRKRTSSARGVELYSTQRFDGANWSRSSRTASGQLVLFMVALLL